MKCFSCGKPCGDSGQCNHCWDSENERDARAVIHLNALHNEKKQVPARDLSCEERGDGIWNCDTCPDFTCGDNVNPHVDPNFGFTECSEFRVGCLTIKADDSSGVFLYWLFDRNDEQCMLDELTAKRLWNIRDNKE